MTFAEYDRALVLLRSSPFGQVVVERVPAASPRMMRATLEWRPPMGGNPTIVGNRFLALAWETGAQMVCLPELDLMTLTITRDATREEIIGDVDVDGYIGQGRLS